MPIDIAPLTYGTFYHIYNRGNNRENIFLQERNYAYFLNLWWKHISPVAETWAYCLLRNHFHAAVYIKDPMTDLSGLKASTPPGVDTTGDLTGLKHKPPHQYFSNFFNAYARGVNIAVQRTGALFERPFQRIPVDSESYLMRLIVYVLGGLNYFHVYSLSCFPSFHPSLRIFSLFCLIVAGKTRPGPSLDG